MRKIRRALPYLSLVTVGLILYAIDLRTSDPFLQNLFANVLANIVFFLVAFVFYDLTSSIVRHFEKQPLVRHLRRRTFKDVLVLLYSIRKVLHGYSLETNTLQNFIGQTLYSRKQIKVLLRNKTFVGFQILKKTEEITDLFGSVLTDPLVLKYEDHVHSVDLLEMIENLRVLENELKTEKNFDLLSEPASEYVVVDGKMLNTKSDDKMLLLKRTEKPGTHIVYDSGYFSEVAKSRLLKQYTLKSFALEKLSLIVYRILRQSKRWIPKNIFDLGEEVKFDIFEPYYAGEKKFFPSVGKKGQE